MKKFIILLIIIGAAWYYQQFPHLTKTVAVDFMGLNKVESRVYLDKNMDELAQGKFLEELTFARQRVNDFFGTREANPIIIAGDTDDVFKKFGSDTGTTAITHFTPWQAYIVLAPNGLNRDVIAHELSHAEIFESVGYFKRNKLPVWFDEGLAMQTDYRPDYSESEYQRVFNGREPKKLGEIDSREEFWADSDEETDENYLTAKHEVSRWYQSAGGKDIKRLLQALGGAGNFYTTYYLLEE